MSMFRCCFGAGSQPSIREDQSQPVENTRASKSSAAKVQDIELLRNPLQTETRSPRAGEESKTVVAHLGLDQNSAASSAAGGYSSKSAGRVSDDAHGESFGRATQVQRSTVPSAGPIKQDIIKSLESYNRYSILKSGDPNESLNAIISFLNSNKPVELAFIDYHVSVLDSALKGTKVQADMSRLLKLSKEAIMKNQLYKPKETTSQSSQEISYFGAGGGGDSKTTSRESPNRTHGKSYGRSSQVQRSVAPSTGPSRQDIIKALENYKSYSILSSGDPMESLNQIISFLNNHNPVDSAFVDYHITVLDLALQETQIQEDMRCLLEQSKVEIMRNQLGAAKEGKVDHLGIATKDVVVAFEQENAGGIQAKSARTIQKRDQLREVQKHFPFYVECRGDGACAYTGMVKGALLQLSKSPASKLDDFLNKINRYHEDVQVQTLCNSYLTKIMSRDNFFQELNSSAEYEASIVRAVQSRVIDELKSVYKNGYEKDHRVLGTDLDDAFFRKELDAETLKIAKLAGLGIEEYMSFEERIVRIESGKANQVSAQEINIFAHVFGQSFLDVNLQSGKLELTQYPLVRGQRSKTFATYNRDEQFALLMKTNGHHNVVLKSDRYGN
ncbi:hypothetical protein DID75_03475 [Candidatus Marinamargulisbacteria bacterium SCGC AG-410-N11]|nr:hypothetical protein DID75_03475 [Candidatus Marinamargulisbacteria bacterium SCGC AG-410-N11]